LKKDLHNKFCEGFDKFREAPIIFFRNIAGHRDELTSLSGDGFESYLYLNLKCRGYVRRRISFYSRKNREFM